MAYVEYESITVTMTASGNSTTYSSKAYTGFPVAISHTATTGTPLSTTCALTIKGENGLTILELAAASSTWTYYPRHLVDLTSGASTSTGTSLAYSVTGIPLAQEHILITLSSNASTAGCDETFKVWIGG